MNNLLYSLNIVLPIFLVMLIGWTAFIYSKSMG